MKNSYYIKEMSEKEEQCCICLEEMKLPYKLECNHQFCFLCLKASYERNQQCPLCRREIPSNLIKYAKSDDLELNLTKTSWFYSGRNGGWWAYDPVSSNYLETEYKKYQEDPDLEEVRLEIPGGKFIINFETMEQISIHGRRKVKRVLSEDELETVKGIAGISIEI